MIAVERMTTNKKEKGAIEIKGILIFFLKRIRINRNMQKQKMTAILIFANKEEMVEKDGMQKITNP